MFQIGQTSGVGKISEDSGNPVSSIKDYLQIMAKRAEDLPCCAHAAAKVVEISKGFEPKAYVTSIGAAASGDPDTDSQSDETSEAADKASGCCRGNRSAADKGVDSKKDPAKESQKWCCGGKCSGSIDPGIEVPSTTADILGSSLSDIRKTNQMSADEFRRNFCDKKPYPECAACQFASQIGSLSEADLYSILRGIKTGIDALTKGSIDFADSIFRCPGQLSALLGDKLGPLGAIVGPCAAGALIGMTAVSGAVSSFAAITSVYANTDLLGELRNSVGRLIGSGGVTRQFTNMANDMITKLGIITKDLYVSSPSNPNRAYTSTNTRLSALFAGEMPNELSVLRANLLDKQLERLWDQAEAAMEFPSATAYYAKTPSSKQTYVAATNDTNAKAGVDYSYKKPDGTLQKIDVQPGEPLEEYRAEHGTLYTEEDAEETPGTNPKPQQIPSTEYKPAQPYSYYVQETDSYTELGTLTYEEYEAAKREHGTVYEVIPPTPAEPVYQQATERIAKENETYYYFDETTSEFKEIADDVVKVFKDGVFVDGKVLDEVAEKQGYDVIYVKPAVKPDKLPQNDPLVMDDGTMFTKPVPADSSALEEVVDAPNLVTRTHIHAYEMAELNGIGLSLYEIKMAYILDHVHNGTILPEDVDAEVIPTVLDTLADEAA